MFARLKAFINNLILSKICQVLNESFLFLTLFLVKETVTEIEL